MATPTTLADDLLIGAQAIAEYIGVDRAQVYKLSHLGYPAIVKTPGLGLTARKSALDTSLGRSASTTTNHEAAQ